MVFLVLAVGATSVPVHLLLGLSFLTAHFHLLKSFEEGRCQAPGTETLI